MFRKFPRNYFCVLTDRNQPTVRGQEINEDKSRKKDPNTYWKTVSPQATFYEVRYNKKKYTELFMQKTMSLEIQTNIHKINIIID